MLSPINREKKRKQPINKKGNKKQLENKMMVIHHSKFVPERSYNVQDGRPKFGTHKLYYSFGYTSEYYIEEPLLSDASLESSEFSNFLDHMYDDDNICDDELSNIRKEDLFQYKTVVTDHEDLDPMMGPSQISNSTTSTNNNIVYNGINHDPTLQTNAEVKAMTKHHKVVQRYGLTVPLFKHSLKLQPKILHLTFHGEYDINTNKSSVKFDATPAFVQLLSSSQTFLYKGRTKKYYRDYIAAISRLWEEEFITFVHQQQNQLTKMPIYAKCTYIKTDLIIDKKPKMRQLFIDIAQRRFGCATTHYPNKKCMVIWWGQWLDVNTIKQKPNDWLLEEYFLSSLCRNRQIDGICRQIKTKYNKICAKNQNLIDKLNRHYQLYQWTIMNIAISQIIPKQVWSWLDNLDDHGSDDEEEDNDDNNNNTSNEDNSSSSESTKKPQQNGAVTNGEIYNAFERTYELTVSPIIDFDDEMLKIKQRANPTETEQKIIEQEIRAIMEHILKDIRQDIVISPGREFESPWLPPPLLNYKILRFKNESAIYNVRTKVIAKFQRNYRNRYSITFTPLSKASAQSHELCGYIPLNEQRSYEITYKDEISNIISEKLVSKEECKIKLLLLLGCHSYQLAKVFEPYIECIICVHPHTQIDDNTCVKFSEYFYKNLASMNGKTSKLKYRVIKSFQDSVAKLKKLCRNDNGCALHGHIHHDHEHHHCHYHPNGEFLDYSVNKQNITREEHLKELNKYKHELNQYQHPLHSHYELPALMIIRIGCKSSQELQKYVVNELKLKIAEIKKEKSGDQNKHNKQEQTTKPNFYSKKPSSSKKKNIFYSNTKSTNSYCSAQSIAPKYSRKSTGNNSQNTAKSSARGGSINYEYSQETVVIQKSHPSEKNLFDSPFNSPQQYGIQQSLGITESLEPDDSIFSIQTDADFEHAHDHETNGNDNNIKDHELENAIISWEWYESKISSDFDYSIIKCSSDKTKKIIKDILDHKKYDEEDEINRIFKKQQTLGPILQRGSTVNNENMTDIDDDFKVNFNLRWDVTDLPICCCSIDAPHRVEDKLVLLIDGKQVQGRDIKLPAIKKDKSQSFSKPSKSEPIPTNRNHRPWFPKLDQKIIATDPVDLPSTQIMDIDTQELVNDDYDGDNDVDDDHEHDEDDICFTPSNKFNYDYNSPEFHEMEIDDEPPMMEFLTSTRL